MTFRSSQWFQSRSDHTFQHRTAMRAAGHAPESFIGKPVIGIFNSWNDLNSCNYPHRELVEHVKRGVLLAGGYPVELHTISVPGDFMKPSDLPYRNLMSMDVEELIRSQPIDGVVLLSECDKTIPAQLMGAASCNVPALLLAAGHRTSGTYRGQTINYGTDLWKRMDEKQAGQVSDEEWKEMESCFSCSRGGCPVMGTASTMKCLTEILGMMLPGTSCIPAHHAERRIAAEMTGKQIVQMVRDHLTPSKLMTETSFHNAITLLGALGGSTNAVIHLIALAGRLGIALALEDFRRFTANVPLLVNLQPSGPWNMDDFYRSGGLSAVIYQLFADLDTTRLCATGETLENVYARAPIYDAGVIARLDAPFRSESSIAVLYGNLVPKGAIVKLSAATPSLLKTQGKAVVFANYADMELRIHRDDLEVDASSILVLQHCGPVGEGMPEWGMMPIPRKLLLQGVRDMVRISDARMSGTSFGTVILHAAPEAAIGGPLGLVRDGDTIELDIPSGTLTLRVDEEELQERRRRRAEPASPHTRGYMRLFREHVLQADEGCDLDFLRPKKGEAPELVPPIVGRG